MQGTSRGRSATQMMQVRLSAHLAALEPGSLSAVLLQRGQVGLQRTEGVQRERAL